MHQYIYFMTLMNLSIMSTCSLFTYIYTRIGIRYHFNCDMSNSLSPWTMVTLNTCASYLYITMSVTFLIWAVDIYLHGWAVTNFNLSVLVARKGYPLTKNKLMYNCTYLWCSNIGNGSGMRSILSDFGCYLFILPCNMWVDGP